MMSSLLLGNEPASLIQLLLGGLPLLLYLLFLLVLLILLFLLLRTQFLVLFLLSTIFQPLLRFLCFGCVLLTLPLSSFRLFQLFCLLLLLLFIIVFIVIVFIARLILIWIRRWARTTRAAAGAARRTTGARTWTRLYIGASLSHSAIIINWSCILYWIWVGDKIYHA